MRVTTPWRVPESGMVIDYSDYVLHLREEAMLCRHLAGPAPAIDSRMDAVSRYLDSLVQRFGAGKSVQTGPATPTPLRS